MGISLVSISHKIAPLEIRKLFAFTKEQQEHLMTEMLESKTAQECVVISTCNRTEIYTYREDDKKSSYTQIQNLILNEAAAQEVENIGDYIRFYQGEQAIRHLFLVASGLDSMVIGEDQILGQVKDAHALAKEIGATGVYLNTFFRFAVTGAKKVKTDTALSKTSVSTASLAIKAAEETLGTLCDKKVMIIGASGKIGGIVTKNLSCMKGVQIYVTVRNTALAAGHSEASVSSYQDRYEQLDEMDVIVSATSSPHYTLTCSKVLQHLKTDKPRVFIDLAVPMDIEKKIEKIPGAVRFDIDDFEHLAEENNQKKKHEAKVAGKILEDYILDFERWLAFQRTTKEREKITAWVLEEAQKKGLERAINKMFYRMRENSMPEELMTFMKNMSREEG